VQETFGSQAAFSVRIGRIVDWSEVAGKPGQVAIGASMLLVIALGFVAGRIRVAFQSRGATPAGWPPPSPDPAGTAPVIPEMPGTGATDEGDES
jgi:hypothetical protein